MIGSEIIIEGMIFYDSLIIVVEIIVYIDDIKSE